MPTIEKRNRKPFLNTTTKERSKNNKKKERNVKKKLQCAVSVAAINVYLTRIATRAVTVAIVVVAVAC